MEKEDSKRDFGQIDGTRIIEPFNAKHYYYTIRIFCIQMRE